MSLYVGISPLTNKETRDYEDWRSNHKCLSNVEFRIVPDVVSQSVRVACLTCGEVRDITDWDSA